MRSDERLRNGERLLLIAARTLLQLGNARLQLGHPLTQLVLLLCGPGLVFKVLAGLCHERVVARLQRLQPLVCLLELLPELLAVLLRAVALPA